MVWEQSYRCCHQPRPSDIPVVNDVCGSTRTWNANHWFPQPFKVRPPTHRLSHTNRALSTPPIATLRIPERQVKLFICLLHCGARIHKTSPPKPLVTSLFPLLPPSRGSSSGPRFPALLPRTSFLDAGTSARASSQTFKDFSLGFQLSSTGSSEEFVCSADGIFDFWVKFWDIYPFAL